MLSFILLISLLIFIASLFAMVLFKILLKLAVYIGPFILSLHYYSHSDLWLATIWLVIQFAIWAYIVDNDKLHPPLA